MKRRFKASAALILISVVALAGKFVDARSPGSAESKPSASAPVSAEFGKQNASGESEKATRESEVHKAREEYLKLDVHEVEIPILMYHSISDSDPGNTLLVPVDQFEAQIKWLSEEGFTPMSMEEVLNAFSTGMVPEKPVAITFDDGYRDNYTDAYRILKKYGMKATFFVITDKIDSDGGYMNSDMLRDMNRNGMEIENHTSKHLEFTGISRADKAAIIKEGAQSLREKIGVESKFICYPAGRYDDETIEVERDLGVKAAVTTENGVSSLSDGLHSLSRLRVAPGDIESFKGIFSN